MNNIKKVVSVNNKMQKGYKYILSEPISKNFANDFKPELSPPKQMLALGVLVEIWNLVS